MSSGCVMTPTTHGIREASKEDRPEEVKVKAEEKEREKEEEEEGTSDQGKEMAEEKEERKAAVTWRVKKDTKRNGMKMMDGMRHGMTAFRPMIKIGMMAIGPVKNYTTRMSMVISRDMAKEK